MLGSLARWIRMMGYDCRYEKALEDSDIINLAKDEGRRILTRDRDLAERGNGLFIDSTSLDDQLKIVSEEYNLRFNQEEMRCSVCNGSLVRIDKKAAADSVPEKSLAHATSFWKCDSCRKVYWDGTHWNGIIDRFRRLGLTEDAS